MTHRCHAHGCETPCQPRMLFCLRHWRMVPKPIQSAVWQTYRRGQERTKRPSHVYLVVQGIAVAAVGLRDGSMTVDQAKAHALRWPARFAERGYPVSQWEPELLAPIQPALRAFREDVDAAGARNRQEVMPW